MTWGKEMRYSAQRKTLLAALLELNVTLVATVRDTDGEPQPGAAGSGFELLRRQLGPRAAGRRGAGWCGLVISRPGDGAAC